MAVRGLVRHSSSSVVVDDVSNFAEFPNRRVAVKVLHFYVLSPGVLISSLFEFGLLGGIQNIINIINGTIRSALNAINGATEALRSIHEQIVWPVSLINRARSSITSIIDEFRNVLRSMYVAPTNSATLVAPIGLESSLRNGQTDDFASLVRSYHEV